MPVCSICRRKVLETQIFSCYDCGRIYCMRCVEEYPEIKTLEVCPDCEEVFEAEEDYWGWGEEE